MLETNDDEGDTVSSNQLETLFCMMSLNIKLLRQTLDLHSRPKNNNSCATCCTFFLQPLHHAARGEHVDIIRILLATGADPTKTNMYGKVCTYTTFPLAFLSLNVFLILFISRPLVSYLIRTPKLNEFWKLLVPLRVVSSFFWFFINFWFIMAVVIKVVRILLRLNWFCYWVNESNGSCLEVLSSVYVSQ